jgi:hypothetical protein
LICANQGDSTLSVLFNGPVLNIKPSGNGVVVSWLSIWTGWTLRQNSNLVTPHWPTSVGVISDDGTNKSLTITSTTGNVFFRLSNP